jgi:hypothetical protein
MYEFIKISEFARYLFDNEELADKAAHIMEGILEARSPRLSDISQRMRGNPAGNYKEIQRFLGKADPREGLLRLFQEEAPFVIGDPTEIPRPQAWKTSYVGTLKDGKTKGFWMLMLATPFRGRAIPCGFVTYSSQTIADQANSRNLEHDRAFQTVKDLLGERPLVLDREFSYLALLEKLVAEEVNFVIRLNLGSQPPVFTNPEGERVELVVLPGKTAIYRQLYYRGRVAVNLIGVWRKGFKRPLWVMTNLAPQAGLQIYHARMKIEESFKDLKSLLGLEKIMNKSQENMEKMVALLLMTYTIGLLVGEALRDQMYGTPQPPQETAASSPSASSPAKSKGKRWGLYSGLFILLKQKILLSRAALEQLVLTVLQSFAQLVRGYVRTFV